MKRFNFLKPHSNRTLTIMTVLLFAAPSIVSSAITSISNIQLSNPAPSPGETVSITWNWTVGSDWNDPRMAIAISTQCALRNAQISGQWLVYGDGCAAYANPAIATAEGAGCDMGQNFVTGTHSSAASGNYSFKIPEALIPGQTYYAIVAMRNYNIYIRNSGFEIERQACVPFTVPLPLPYIRLSKIAEGTTVEPGTRVLFTINYDIGNVTNARITDSVNANFDIVAVYNGGTFSGHNITWNLGNISSPRKGYVSFLAQARAGLAAGTVIPNTAFGQSNEVASAQSNRADVTVSAPGMSINKSASSAVADLGSTITYSMHYVNTGMRLVEFQNFDTGTIPPAGWSFQPAGGTWTNVNGYLEQTQNISSYPALMNNMMTPVHDAVYILDMKMMATNTGHFDATFRFNNCGAGTGYQARIHSNSCAGITDPSHLILEVPTGTGVTTIRDVQNPHGLVMQCDQWYTVKIKVSGTSIMMKVWPRGEDEYPGWDININDATATCASGIVGFQANEGPTAWDNLKVFEIAGSTSGPRVYDTIPAGISYVAGSCVGGTSCGVSAGMLTWAVGNTGADTQIVSWRGIVAGACGSVITNRAGIDSTDSPPAVISNNVYTTILCVPTPTPSATRSPTTVPTATVTHTRTATMTVTRTPTGTPTPVNTLTFTSTATFSVTQSSTATRTATPSVTLTATASMTLTATFSPTQSATLSRTPSRTNTPVNTATFTSTSTPTFSGTPTGTLTRTPTGTPTGTPTRTASPTATFTATPTGSATATFTFTVTDTVSSNTPTMLPTFSATPTATLSHTMSATRTNSATTTHTPTVTNSETQSPTGTSTASPTFTPTPSPSVSVSPSATVTDTVSSNTPTQAATNTASPTLTATMSLTLTHTFTLEASFTYTMTVTNTVSSNTPTVTLTPAFTATHTPTPSATPSATAVMTAVLTFTPTQTPEPPISGTPSDIRVSIIAAGDEPRQGARVDYYIRIKNEGNTPAYNFAVWETLPANISFYANRSSVVPVIDGKYLYWDIGSYVLPPGEFIEIGFTVKIDYVTPGNYIYTTAGVDFNDSLYTEITGRHPPVFSTAHIYPESEIIVFPNPFNPGMGSGKLKFLNTPPGSMIKIYTVSGELVSAFFADYYREEWDGKNRHGNDCTPGIYYYTVTTRDTRVVKKGKVILIRKPQL